MKIGRVLIAAVMFLGGGLWTILNYCHGTTGLSFALPVDGSKLNIDLTTMGVAVWIGVPLIAIGLGLLTIAVLASIVVQFMPQKTHAQSDPSPKPSVPFDR